MAIEKTLYLFGRPMKKEYTISIEKDKSGFFVAEVAGLPACYTQARTIPELLARIAEVSEGSVSLQKDMEDKKIRKDFTLSLKVDYATA